KTQQLKERQNYLRELINEQTEETPPPDEAKTAKPEAKARATPEFIARILKTDSEADNLSVQVLKRELARLESYQQDLARSLVAALATEIDTIVSLLQSTGISKEGLFRLAFGAGGSETPLAQNQGGPFVAPEDGTAIERLARPADEDAFASLAKYHGELQALHSVLKTAPFVEPLDNYYVSSGYGYRRDPF